MFQKVQESIVHPQDCSTPEIILDRPCTVKKSMANFLVTSASVSTAKTFGAGSPGAAEASTEVAASLIGSYFSRQSILRHFLPFATLVPARFCT